jgi:tetratricopeptide (TPR) repeat protein
MKPLPSSQAVILNVPFISWDEERLSAGEMNPSDPASLYMMFEYWGEDVTELSDEDETENFLSDWTIEHKDGTSVNDLKPFIADRIPILVRPTGLTPFAHPINPMNFELGVSPYPETRDPVSGSLDGLFVPLDYAGLAIGPDSRGRIREDFLWSARVVVGYDDSRSIVYLHDPTFGPYWEVGYDDFEKMWEVGGRGFHFYHPPDYEAVLAELSLNADHTSRSPDHQATVRYVFGYALSSIGRNEEAEAQLRQGLEIEGVEDGYRFLLLLELSVVRAKSEDFEEAIVLAKEASRLLPQHHASWFLLASLYKTKQLGKVKYMLPLVKAKYRQTSRKGSAKLPPNLAYNARFMIR